MHEQFVREMPEKADKDKTWQWLSESDSMIGTEPLLCIAQEQAIRKNYVKYKSIQLVKVLCRLRGEKGESVQHLVSGCEKLAQKEYKRRHDNVGKKFHWHRCKNYGLGHTEKWYEHVPERAVRNEEVKVLWDINVQCDKVVETRKPDIILIDKKEQKGIIINIVVPADVRVGEKEREKMEKYQDLKREIGRLWKLKMVEVVPVVIGALGRVTKEFDGWIEKLGITNNVGIMHVRILRKVLEM